MTAVCGISTDITANKAAERSAAAAAAEVEAARAELDRQNHTLREQAVALRQQAAALAEGELRLRSILDNSPGMIYAKDRAGRFLFANRACAALVGRTEAQMLGRTSRDLYPGDGVDAVMDHDEQVWRTGQAGTFEERITVDGRPLCVLSSRFPLTDAAGRMTAVCGISTDITARLAAEAAIEHARAELDRQNRTLRQQAAALAEGELRLRSIMDNSQAMIFAKDRAGRVLFMNREGVRLHGRPEADLVGRTIGQIYPPAMAELNERHDARVWADGRRPHVRRAGRHARRAAAARVRQSVPPGRRRRAHGRPSAASWPTSPPRRPPPRPCGWPRTPPTA